MHFAVPDDGTVVLGVTGCCDGDFSGSHHQGGTYQLSVRELAYAGSISGRVVDGASNLPLPGDTDTYAGVYLFRCVYGECYEQVSLAAASDDGTFRLDQDSSGNPLFAGTYRVGAYANGYATGSSDLFEIAEGEHKDIGDILVHPIEYIGSIRGLVVDADTGAPIPGYQVSYAYVELLRCFDSVCPDFAATASINDLGEFVFFGTDYMIEAGDFQIIAHASGYFPETSEIFSVSSGEEVSLGDLSLAPIPLAGSISGRIVDAITGEPLPGMAEPFAFVDLWRLSEWEYYEWINGQNTDNQGNFRFERDYMGNRLAAGSYQITVYATDYQYFEGEAFEVGEEEHFDLGDIGLTPYPVYFSDIQSCGELPPEGGTCTYSVEITNRSGRRLAGAAWSLIDIWGTGSFTGYTHFQVGRLEKFNLPAGSSDKVSFSVQVPGTLTEGSSLCSQVYVGEGRRDQYFNTIGQSYLFCVEKSATEFSLLSAQEAQNLMRERHQGNPVLQRMVKRPKK